MNDNGVTQAGIETQVRQLLVTHFDLEELKTLCLDTGVDYEELGGEGKTAKVRELIAALQRRDRLDTLMAAAARLRPQVGWPGPAPADLSCPYRGLLAFREEDAAFFFGRERMTHSLVTAVQRRAFTAVVGPSGSGKSSVLFAGLLPRLHHQGRWLLVPFRPGGRPFQALAAALLPLLEPEMSEADRLAETLKLATVLRQEEMALAEVTRLLEQKYPQAGSLLLVADQFEELYTLCPEPAVRHRFLDVLIRPGSARSYHLVVALRADFWGQALAHRPLADALQDHTLLLGPMTRDELQQAIVRPAFRLGVRFQAGLVGRILDNVGPDPGNLPLLQFALTLLWERQEKGCLTHATYEAIGRAEGALAGYAEEIYAALSEAEQFQARRVLVQLVHLGEGTEDARRRAARAELGEEDWPVVQQLANARLVVTGQDAAGQETIELAHEALIHNWGRLAGWLASDRAFRAWQERLRTLRRQWEGSSQDEGALLRGAPLAEAREWLARREADLSLVDQGFIRESLTLREREMVEQEARRQRELAAAQQLAAVQQQQADEQRQTNARLRRWVRLSTIAFCMAAILVVVALLLAQESRRYAAWAQQQSRLAYARELAARSAEALPRDADLGLSLAVQAVNATYETDGIYTAEAQAALYQALTVPSFQGVLPGHTAQVTAAHFSPDGSRIVTTSADNTARLWDADGHPLAVLEGHSALVTMAAFSPDGARLATASEDGTARLWDADGYPLAALEGHSAGVVTVAFSPDGAYLVTASVDGTAWLWDADGNSLAVLEGHTAGLTQALFSPDGALIATTSLDGTAWLWDVNGNPLAILEGHAGGVMSAAYHPAGISLATAGEDSTVWLWDLNGSPLAVLEGHQGAVRSVAFDATGTHLVTASMDGTARLWDTDSSLLAVLGSGAGVTAARFSPDGSRLVTAGVDRFSRLWDTAGHLLAVFEGHTGVLWSADFSPDGSRVVTASEDGTARLWGAAGEGGSLATLDHQAAIRSVAFSPDGGSLLTTGDGVARLWDADGNFLAALDSPDAVAAAAFHPDGSQVATAGCAGLDEWGGCTAGLVQLWNSEGEPVVAFQAHTATINLVVFSPDGQQVVTLGCDEMDGAAICAATSARVWDTAGNLLAVLEGAGSLNGVAFSGDGRYLAATSWDGTAQLWQLDGDRLTALAETTGPVWLASFSPNSTRLVTAAGWGGAVHLWDVAGQPLATLDGHTGAVWSAVFSPDGTRLATASLDGTARLWDSDGRPLAVLQGHTSAVLSVRFNNSGTRLVTTSADGTARLWDENGHLITRFDGRTGVVWAADFSPDGTRLVTASADGTARLWPVFPDIETMLAEAGQRLSPKENRE
ncbi:MAG: WD40 repeat domain-containing protein [Chloroflexi bacterium]|nr:WD40 repeat domain-containing protein [Chloroflexota bacterium]MCI0647815.1 WD40 repeat domain-containing protein [Chloroflexota bacterium]